MDFPSEPCVNYASLMDMRESCAFKLKHSGYLRLVVEKDDFGRKWKVMFASKICSHLIKNIPWDRHLFFTLVCISWSPTYPFHFPDFIPIFPLYSLFLNVLSCQKFWRKINKILHHRNCIMIFYANDFLCHCKYMYAIVKALKCERGRAREWESGREKEEEKKKKRDGENTVKAIFVLNWHGCEKSRIVGLYNYVRTLSVKGVTSLVIRTAILNV